MKIASQAFIVTGGASGLGAATTRELVQRGAKVVVADLNAQAGEALVSELGDSVRFVACDITKSEDVEHAVQTAEKEFGGLAGSINCAGIAIVQKLLDRDNNPADLEQFNKGVQVNLIGSFNVARLVAASIAKRVAASGGPNNEDQGIIINTASIAAFDGQVGQASYASSKSGVVGLTLPLARELTRHGIRVMTIAPGIFETPMMAGLPEKAQEQLKASVPYPKRLGMPAEYANLVAHIIENAYLNGEVIRLDGAIRMT
ncbi:SDR family NAD(P)-dependent oxidoreductase [Psychrobacter sp. H7-1]|uniref:SDR family NAD(P)-dependent oxidoreductase n=1 Tax=Psychrobacter sp. H7-1 TaxID=1569265 RepID=UPI001919B28A|nr:SDR family NAD(P)-dependent oxidoreductase [Psychrobacter sp. H7-1]